jgi:5,10-methylenetetrahydromethanopterin reductase
MARAERAGFRTAWVPDSQFLFRDAWMTLAAGALATERIRLATGVTNLRTRHPSVTAAALQTLEEAAPGRAVLGVGTGDSSVKGLGLGPTRLADLERACHDIRTLGGGGSVEYGGRRMRLRDATGRVPPIVVAATGPRALELAGRIADGVLIMAGVSPPLVREAMGHVEAGLSAAGRSRPDIEVCVGAVCDIVANGADVVRIAKPHCAGDAQRGAAVVLRESGVDVRGTVPQHIPEVYPDITHAEDWDRAVQVAGRWISDEAAARYAECFTLIGTAGDVVARVRAAVDAGADSFYLRHFRSYVLPDDLVDTFGSAVIEEFAAPS